MPQITPWLESRCRLQRLAGSTSLLLAGLAVFDGVCLGMWGVAAITSPFDETTAEYTLSYVAILLLALTIRGIRRLRRRRTLVGKAREYSREFPDDHDALETAVELEGKVRKGESLRPFEQEYLAQLQSRYSAERFARFRGSRTFARPRWWPQLLAALVLLLLFLYVRNPVLQSAWLAMTSLKPGLEFVALPPEIVAHYDLDVLVQINRHGGQAQLEIRDAAGTIRRFAMQGTGKLQNLMLYDVSEPVSLRARTPFAKTAWQDLAVYDPPSPDSIALDTEPPGYSRRPPQHRDNFDNLEILEGETLRVQCEMPEGQSWKLLELTDRAPRGITVKPNLTPDHDMRLQALFQDAKGHVALGPVFRIVVQPDLAPDIELIEPKEDATCKAGQAPVLKATVRDDFGVSSVVLHYHIDNQEESTQFIYHQILNDYATELPVDTVLELGDAPLVPGQLITGWLEAADNREPEHRRARSGLFFITVTPDESSFEANLDGMDGGDQHEVTLGDLIEESKRLLRNTFDMLYSAFEPSSRERLRAELERDLRALELAVRARSVDLAAQVGMPKLPEELQRYFDVSAADLLQAAADVATDAVAASRAPQRAALVTLVELNNMLLENMMKASGGGDSSVPEPGEPSEGDEAQESTKPSPANADRQQQISQLETARDELRKILQAQRAVLDEIQRANRIASAFAEPERKLASRTRIVAKNLAGIAEARTIQDNLRQSWTELDNAGQNFATVDNHELAATHARRGENFLKESLWMVEDLLRQLSTRQIEKLGEDARKLGERQRELAGQSAEFGRNPPDDSGRRTARDRQEALAQETAALRDQIERTARAMEREHPQDARKLRETLTNDQSAALQRAQSRAKNALTYRRYEIAASEQETAAAELAALAERLDLASAQIGLSPEQLEEALEKAERLAEEASRSQAAEELSAITQESAKLASQTGRQLGNEALQRIGTELSGDEAENASPQLRRTKLVEQLVRIRHELQTELQRLQKDGMRRLPSPPHTTPPRQYRQEVEEYFRRISE